MRSWYYFERLVYTIFKCRYNLVASLYHLTKFGGCYCVDQTSSNRRYVVHSTLAPSSYQSG
jgi:hypothetical protein